MEQTSHSFEECSFRKFPYVVCTHPTLDQHTRVRLQPARDVEYMFGLPARLLTNCPLELMMRLVAAHESADDLGSCCSIPQPTPPNFWLDEDHEPHAEDGSEAQEADTDQQVFQTMPHCGLPVVTLRVCVHKLPMSAVVDGIPIGSMTPSTTGNHREEHVYVWFLCDISRLFRLMDLPVYQPSQASSGAQFNDPACHYVTHMQRLSSAKYTPPERSSTTTPWFSLSLSSFGTIDEAYPSNFLGHHVHNMIDKPIFRFLYDRDVPRLCTLLSTGAPRGVLHVRLRWCDARLAEIYRNVLLNSSDTLGDSRVKQTAVSDAMSKYGSDLTLSEENCEVYRPVEMVLFMHEYATFDRPTYVCLVRALPLRGGAIHPQASPVSVRPSTLSFSQHASPPHTASAFSRALPLLKDAVSGVVLALPGSSDIFSPKASPLPTPSSSIPGLPHRQSPVSSPSNTNSRPESRCSTRPRIVDALPHGAHHDDILHEEHEDCTYAKDPVTDKTALLSSQDLSSSWMWAANC